jgi:hypothetical protein
MQWKRLFSPWREKSERGADLPGSSLSFEIPIPAVALHELNCNIYSDLRNENDIDQKGFYLSVMDEVLRCQTRFVLSIYLSLYLEQDFSDEKLDARVLGFFSGRQALHNEMLGLCEGLCRTINEYTDSEYYRPFQEKKLLLLYLGDLRLPPPPMLTVLDGNIRRRYDEYAGQIITVGERMLSKKASFLTSPETRLYCLQRREKIVNELGFYRFRVEHYLLGREEEQTQVERYINDTGNCRLEIAGLDIEPLKLDPVLIPLRNDSRKARVAALVNMSSISDGVRDRLEYVELFGDGRRFTTNDDQFYREMYFKKGNVLEAPVFPYRYLIKTHDNREMTVKLYDGDIFNLNFLKGVRKQDRPRKKAALVNVVYRGGDRTELAEVLEVIAGIDFETVAKGKFKGRKTAAGIISSSRVGKLNFDRIYHCPFYEHGDGVEGGEKRVERFIDELLSQVVKDNIEILVVPTFGVFSQGQRLDRVAELWHLKLRHLKAPVVLKIRKELHLEEVVFGISDRQALNEYSRVFRARTAEIYDMYHYPAARLLCDLNNAEKAEERYALNLDLAEYISQYLAALSLRSILFDCHRATARNEPFIPSPAKREFLLKFLELSGFDSFVSGIDTMPESKKMSMNLVGKRMTAGKWQLLAHLGIKAISEDKWGLDLLVSDDRRKTFLQSVNTNLPASVRNKVSHANRNLKIDLPYDAYCEELEPQNLFMIEETGCFRQKNISMILVAGFEVDEDQNLCTLCYRDLRGIMEVSSHPEKKVSWRFEGLYQGHFFETGKVFLVRGLPEYGGELEEAPAALNLYPFIVFGRCSLCGRENGFFVWYDFKIVADRVSVLYRPLSCTCDLDDVKVTGDFHADDIRASFSALLGKTIGPVVSFEEPDASVTEEPGG